MLVSPVGKRSNKEGDLKPHQNNDSEHRSALSQQLQKTQICVWHMKGSCKFGTACTYAHNVEEVRTAPNLRKTQLCQSFMEGTCDDLHCSFAHGEKELRSTDMFYKKRFCVWNARGLCRNGNNCRFAHGLGELRQDPQTESNKRGSNGKGRQGCKERTAVVKGSIGYAVAGYNSPRSTSASDSNPSCGGVDEPAEYEARQRLAMLVQQQVSRVKAEQFSMQQQGVQAPEMPSTTGVSPILSADLQSLSTTLALLSAKVDELKQKIYHQGGHQITLWRDGFIIDNGPLRPLSDPLNKVMMDEMVREHGLDKIPLHGGLQ